MNPTPHYAVTWGCSVGIESFSVLRMECDNGMACERTTFTHPTGSNPLVVQRDALSQGWLTGINKQGLFLTFCPARACQKRGREVLGKVGGPSQ